MISLFLLSMCYVQVCTAFNLTGLFHRLRSIPEEQFGDLTIYLRKFSLFGSAAFYGDGFPFTYPAPVSLGYEVIFRIAPHHPARLFLMFCGVVFLVPVVMFAVALRRRGISTLISAAFAGSLLLTSWPAYLVMDRGNMEVLVWAALVIAVWAYATGRGYLAASFFGVAASLKLFPFIFIGLFLSRREWRKASVAILVFVALSFISLAIMGPTVSEAYRQIAHGIDFFRQEYMASWKPHENGVDHSIFALVKFFAVSFFHHKWFGFQSWLALYLKVTAAVGVLLYVFVIRKLPLLNQILAFSVISILFTAFSGDGTLLHLYYPFALLVLLSIRAERVGRQIPGLQPTMLLLGFCLSYDTFLVWNMQQIEGEAKCVALVAILLITVRKPLSITWLAPPADEGTSEASLDRDDLHAVACD